MSKKSCKECLYFRPREETLVEGNTPKWPKSGCARYPAPPVVLMVPTDRGAAQIIDHAYHGPMPDGVCGEFTSKVALK